MVPAVRMYDSEQSARQAADTLREYLFPEEGLLVITPGPDAEGTVDGAVDAGHVLTSQRSVAKRALTSGRTIVAVTPQFGRGQLALDIMDHFGPVDTETIPEHRVSNPDPFSTLLHIPTLTEDQKPFFGALSRHDFFPTAVFPLLSKNQRGKAKLADPRGKAKLADPRGKAKLSANQRGKANLIDAPDLFSSVLGIPTLKKKKRD